MVAINIVVKVVWEPDVPIETSMDNMARLFLTVGVRVDHLSTDPIDYPFTDVEVGSCMDGEITSEQSTLYDYRDGAGPDGIVVYFVRMTIPFYSGCATHPLGRPSAVISSGAEEWVLAHEIGHVLGLEHSGLQDHLMTGDASFNFTPKISDEEAEIMRESNFARPV